MKQCELLANRLEEVLLSGHWIANTNIKQLIEQVNWKHALYQRPGFNSIALLTFHINYYVSGVLSVFNGHPLTIKDRFSFHMTPIHNESEWTALVQNFISNATLFIEKIRSCNDATLSQTFVDEKYGTYQRNIDGIIEHAYYHLGQMVLLKKLTEHEVI